MDFGRVILAGLAGALGALLGMAIWRVFSATTSDPEVARRRIALAGTIGGSIAIGVVPLVEKSGMSDWINLAFGLKSRFEVIAGHEGEAIVAHPRFKALVEGKSEAEIREISMSLSARGLGHLDLPDLQTWTRLRLQMARQSPALCAQMWLGNIDRALALRALDELSDSDIYAFAQVSAKASLAVLDETPVEATDAEVMRRGLERIVASFPEPERSALQRDLASTSVGEGRACELMQIVLRGSADLPDDIERGFLRGLAQQ